MFFQYLFGLRAMGHEVFWLELLRESGDPARDQRRIETFGRRFKLYGLERNFAVLLLPKQPAEQRLDAGRVYGCRSSELSQIARRSGAKC